MKPVQQIAAPDFTAADHFAAAWSACIASILELEVQEVPLFNAGGQDWVREANRWLAARGLFFLEFAAFPPPEYQELFVDFYHIIIGPSPHLPGADHAVVGRAGKIIHDPHPEAKKLLNGQWMHAVLVNTFLGEKT